jgi:hypothetical protein
MGAPIHGRVAAADRLSVAWNPKPRCSVDVALDSWALVFRVFLVFMKGLVMRMLV